MRRSQSKKLLLLSSNQAKGTEKSCSSYTRFLSLAVVGASLLCVGEFAYGVAAEAQRVSVPDEGIAAALFDRGMTLFEEGDFLNAKKMFGESLERSPAGNRSADALRMLRSSNEKLGVSDLDSGKPNPAGSGPLDPYADPGKNSETPVDPYGDPADLDPDDLSPVDPYSSNSDTDVLGPDDIDDPGKTDPDRGRLGRIGLLGHGGAFGSALLMTLAGPLRDDNDDGVLEDLGGGSVLLGIAGGGGGAYLSHFLINKYDLSDGQSAAIATAGFWSMYNFAHLANLVSGDSTNLNDVYLGFSLGGAVGTGIGAWYAKKTDPDVRDISLINSLSLYGTTTALMLGVAIDPPKADAYSLNALVGSVAGIGTAIYLRDELNYSRSRLLKIDMGAGVGALIPWVTIYPALSDSESTSDEQTAGFLSAIGVGIGAYVAWVITEDEDEEEDEEDEGEGSLSRDPAPPALLKRDRSGTWSVSSPMIRPMELPELSPQRGILGADILSGRF